MVHKACAHCLMLRTHFTTVPRPPSRRRKDSGREAAAATGVREVAAGAHGDGAGTEATLASNPVYAAGHPGQAGEAAPGGSSLGSPAEGPGGAPGPAEGPPGSQVAAVDMGSAAPPPPSIHTTNARTLTAL